MALNWSGTVAAVGVGLTYHKRGASPDSERKLVLRAIVDACEDAGLDPRDIDGFASFGHDNHEGTHLRAGLGTRELRWSSMAWGGGGGGLAGAIEMAAIAIATGQATAAVAYRTLAERDSGRLSAAVSTGHMNAHYRAHGIIAPAQVCALRAQRMIEHDGVPDSTLKALVAACYYHAQQNPNASAYGKPFDGQAYDDARWISEPYGLLDCSRENDGAGAVLLVSAEKAKTLRQKPVYILAAAEGAPEGWGENWENFPDYGMAGYKTIAGHIWDQSGLGPKDVGAFQVYENFSGQAVGSIIDFGFCDVASSGEFISLENLIAPTGKLPLNTSGGNIGEGFVHGIGLAVESVRLLRGQSTNQIPGIKTCLLAGGPSTTLGSAVLFGTGE